MRYTTAIDIREFVDVYTNKNAVLLYFHLCLRAGYHQDDRDIVRISLRKLAEEVGITLSACRFALSLLVKYGLVSSPSAGEYRVLKFVSSVAIPKREYAAPLQEPAQETPIEKQKRMQDDTERRLRAQLDGTPQTSEILMLFLYDKAKSGDKAAQMEADGIRIELERIGYHSKWL